MKQRLEKMVSQRNKLRYCKLVAVNVLSPLHCTLYFNPLTPSNFVYILLHYVSLHHTGLTHKLSKLSAVVQEHKQKYKASLESSQADNALVSLQD